MGKWRRLVMFARDYVSEFGCAWWIARTNDCERNGGHRWDESKYDTTMRAFGSSCSRCRCWQSTPIQPIIPTTSGTATAFTVSYNATN